MERRRIFNAIIQVGSVLILPFWVLMLVAPNWSVTRRIIGSEWIIAPLAALYLGGIATAVATRSPDDPQFDMRALSGSDPDALVAAFQQTPAVTISWMHMLALDLFAGRWIYLDSQERKLGYKASPFILLTLMAGPSGLLGYLTFRSHL